MEIIILGAVAGFIIYRLYMVLGQDVGIKLAPEPLRPRPVDPTDEPANFADAKTINGKIKQFKLADPSFSKNHFLEGAGYAFGMVLKAFNEGDTKTLKNLMGPSLFKSYEQEIRGFETSGEKRDDELLRIRTAKLLDLRPKGKTHVEAEVEFTTEQILITRNKKGDIIEGDENQIEVLSDTWTFEKEIASNDPNWTITETKSND